MDQTKFDYSLKNIPNATESTYFKTFIKKIESFISRIRWKAYFFEMSKENDTSSDEEHPQESYGFRTDKVPPRNKELDPFENDLTDMMSRITFKPKKNSFRNKLYHDVKKIKKSKKLLVAADKTTNMYCMDKENYNKLLLENISKDYKKTDVSVCVDINKEANKIAQTLNLENKMEALAEKDAYITLKDHKENFYNKPKCRLINPTKSELGAVSSKKIKEINSSLRRKLKIKQWINTENALDWFKNIKNKEKKKFLQLDIENFYPSINEELLDKAIDFASNHVEVDRETIEIIKHCRKTILFSGNDVWEKKTENSLFDVAQGAKDSAEVCELVGIYILNLINTKFPDLDFGIYRDDGLGCYETMPGHDISTMEKEIHKLFKSINLKIDLKLNQTQVNFLDVTMNIETNKFWPYRKPNSEILYINKNSNHPDNIKKELPKMVNKRLNDIACDKVEFEKVKKEYEDALKKSGFNEKLEYKQINNKKKKNRKRKVIWFNPPFESNVNVDVGKEFLKLISKHFPKKHKYHKLFNRNTIKVSYSCLPNMKSIISGHNLKILNEEEQNNISDSKKTCNCKKKDECPLNGNCQVEAVIYKAIVTTNENQFEYIGSTEKSFKSRYYNHTKSFRNEKYQNETKLSRCVWDLKEENKNYELKWSILYQSKPYKCGSRKCDLCLSEKYQIMIHTNRINCQLLNSRSEIMNKCRHSNKYKINQYN